jgi:hydrogenase maturation factor
MISPLPGKIHEVYNEGNNRIGLVEFDGKRRTIYLNLVPEAQVGDYVRFHAGSRLSAWM